MARLRLVLPEGLDDHERPRDKRLRRFVPPLTQMALWLYRDGTVIRQDHFPDPDAGEVADDVVGGGHDWHGQTGDWQVAVLEAAGYTLVEDVLYGP